MGDKYLRLGSMAPIGKMWQCARIAGQAWREQRLSEAVVGMGRELSWRFDTSIPPDAYYAFSRGSLRKVRSGPWILTIAEKFDRICRCRSACGVLWASRGETLFSVSETLDSASARYQFENEITALHGLSDGSVVVAIHGSVHVFEPARGRCRRSLQLSHPQSLILQSAMAETAQNRLYLGEYGSARDDRGNWIALSYVYQSVDGGVTWLRSNAFVLPGIRHIHLLRYDERRSRLCVTTGDGRKELWTCSVDNKPSGETRGELAWIPAGRSAQRTLGGATSAAYTDQGSYWGSDFWLGTNFITRMIDGGQPRRWVPPGRLRRNPITSMGILASPSTQYILAGSVNQYGRQGGSSAVLIHEEGSNTCELLVLDSEGAMYPFIGECPNSPAGEEILVTLGPFSVSVSCAGNADYL